jgi:hypothetical protein
MKNFKKVTIVETNYEGALYVDDELVYRSEHGINGERVLEALGISRSVHYINSGRELPNNLSEFSAEELGRDYAK